MATHRGIGFERERGNHPFEPFGRAAECEFEEDGLEHVVLLAFDADADPPGLGAEGIAAVLERLASTVADEARLVAEEWRDAVGREEHEESVVTQVTHVRVAAPLATVPRPLREGRAVTLRELAVDRLRVLPLGHAARHVVEVALADAGHRDLLDESLQRGRHESRLFHRDTH
ncbi:hypothetical protein [Tautonia sociabilis]|uniref:Uncharacterized protein n=1 Tax=Tautonia sociabilis TaxID=2080755 RepID=A0A432MF39_9BACT|nr:hypothetical protein [Tautonia sociabilis]RUL84362.1 hypothetical protein TsocGM_20330 [Tautonia sociabilis]